MCVGRGGVGIKGFRGAVFLSARFTRPPESRDSVALSAAATGN